ncbi:MAG: tRNA (adenosine(37)-N6)-threonylcarbamoyltransferase complex ATPase subunit type 1 TsaE [Spirochaetales bacterium]|nr:tRNA (adenosine(37)-N6)-threonylcarbamoyltransferase complex ATPase subunit type 1 TsaE [Spirochaetales bacterium]
MTLISNSANSSIEIGKDLAKKLIPGNIIALRGTLGSGKTTLVKGIAIGLDITDEITSPTYTIISEYTGKINLFHMDLYRIDSIEEFELLGTDEFMYDKNITIIEWSEKISEYLPENTIIVDISILPGKNRKIEIEGI